MSEKKDPLVLGIDLGGTKILTAVVNAKGEMLSRDHSITPAEKGQDAVIHSIYQSMEHSLAQAKIEVSQLAAIAVGAPGPSNPHTGVLYSSPNLPHWKDVPLKNIFEQTYDKRTFLINDGNAAAFAEFRFGAGRDARCFIYVTVSTGIGGGIVIDGKVFTGAIGTAGEIGHMTIDDDGPVCSCGNRGCWEALASGTALAREARRKISEGRSTEILTLAEGEIENVTAEIIQKAFEAGDELAKELVAQTSHHLGTGFGNLINLFNPDIIAVGGGVANMGDMLFQPAYETAKLRAFQPAFSAVRFVPAALGRNSGVIGAAAFAFQELKA